MKPVWTFDQVVGQLTNWEGRWDNSVPVPFMFYAQSMGHHQFNVGFAPFNAAERQSLLRTMELVSDVANVSFVNIPASAQFPSASNPFMGFYTINQASAPFWGAATRYVVDGAGPPQPMGRIYGVDIVVNHHRANVQGGWEIGDSNSRKLMHELLHGLGLDHAGDYNGDSALSYQTHASFYQDSNQYTVMSYWAASETGASHSAGGFVQFASTPLLFDVAALQRLYGANMSTRTGDTVYGFNNTSGRAAFDLQRDPNAVFTIWDAGGVDTLDMSGYQSASRIDLREGAFSDAGGMTSNIAIAYGARIENAVGGSGNDIITGNSLANSLRGGGGNDVLSGGGGDDQFGGTRAQLANDRITDFGPGDRIVVDDATLAGFEFSLSGETLRLGEGVIVTLSGFTGRLVASAALGGGVALTAAALGALSNDFNGDGRSDVFWREAGGAISNWLGRADGGFNNNDAAAYLAGVPVEWRVVGSGDVNGDGRSEILWRNDDGRITNWLGRADGGFTNNDAVALATVATSWRVAGTGDFNGDGRFDILWRHDDGRLSNWLGRADGGFTANDASALSNVSASWRVAGTGDFNGDGRSDILWRHEDGRLSDWLGRADGGFTDNGGVALLSVSTSWNVVGTGDFNGDGRTDILWRSADGALSDWLGRADGGFTPNDAAAYTAGVPTSWHVADTGDYNGDGRFDILWRSDSGALSNWLGRADGGFTNNDAIAFATVPSAWTVQNDYLLV